MTRDEFMLRAMAEETPIPWDLKPDEMAAVRWAIDEINTLREGLDVYHLNEYRLWTVNEFLRSQPRVCVAVVVESPDRRVLLLRRGPMAIWPGLHCFPGGHINPGESIEQCCRRELFEETGLGAGRLDFAGVTEAIDPDQHLIGIVFRASGVAGEPANREPHKHDAIGWHPWGDLPELVPPAREWVESQSSVHLDVENRKGVHRCPARDQPPTSRAASNRSAST